MTTTVTLTTPLAGLGETGDTIDLADNKAEHLIAIGYAKKAAQSEAVKTEKSTSKS